jgi:hypothetical protein
LLRKSITFINPFTEEEVTEDHYFHISKADLVEMEIEAHGNAYKKGDEELTGMQAKLQRIIDAEDGKAVLAEFKDILRRSYGVKEGTNFVKTDENWKAFSGSEAYSQLLFELCTQADAAAEFVAGVIPSNLEQIAAEVQKQAKMVAAGREAQATAKAAGAPVEVPALTDDVPEGASDRQKEIAQATSENPVTLTQVEVGNMDSDELKSGLATGRYKLS